MAATTRSLSPAMFAVDLSALPQEVRSKIDQIFREDHEVKLLRALEEQKRLAAEFSRQRPRSIDGIGEQKMALHPYIDACNRAIVGSQRWSNDQDLREWYLRRYPEARVKSGGTKTQIGWTPPEPKPRLGLIAIGSGNKRWTRSYG